MFVIVIKRGLVVSLHDFHLTEYASTCSFSFLSSYRLGLWRIFGVEKMLYFCDLSYIGGGRGGGRGAGSLCVSWMLISCGFWF